MRHKGTQLTHLLWEKNGHSAHIKDAELKRQVQHVRASILRLSRLKFHTLTLLLVKANKCLSYTTSSGTDSHTYLVKIS